MQTFNYTVVCIIALLYCHYKQLSPGVLDKTQQIQLVHDSPLIGRELEMNKFFLCNHFVLQILIKSSIQIALINFFDYLPYSTFDQRFKIIMKTCILNPREKE